MACRVATGDMTSFQPFNAQIHDLLHETNCMVEFPLQVLKSKSQLGFYSRHIFPVPMNFNVTVTKPSTPQKKSANKIHPPKYNRKSSSNQHFSGDLLVFGGVYTSKYLINNYLENKLLLISINFTPKTSHSCLKLWYTMFSRYQ